MKVMNALVSLGRAPSVYSILLLLLRDSTNYKIRIHAAAALAVPASRFGECSWTVGYSIDHFTNVLGVVAYQ